MATKVKEQPATSTQKSRDKITYDLILVGGSPANLTLAHRLCDLLQNQDGTHLSVAILEKAESFGGHIVSGAVVNKSIFDKAYPNHIADQMPIEAECTESHFAVLSANEKLDVPNVITRAMLPDFVKDGYYILTLSHVVEWMANTLEAKAKDNPNITIDFFNGFPANKVLIEDNKVVGVQISETDDPLEDNIYGSLVCFADKGFISKDVIKHFDLQTNPQLWSVGVKETWKLREDAPDIKGKVWHTLGYPTLDGTLGGGFVYGLNNNKLTIGLVISLDSHNPNIHPQKQLQEYKKHPWLQELIRDGELLHYGAAVLPEGGIPSLPKAFQVDGALLLGDALGLLDVKSLAGVDKAILSGYTAAETVLASFTKRDFSADALKSYQSELMNSPFMDKFKANKYFRKAFLDNPDLLKTFLPKFLDGIEAKNLIYGVLKAGLSNPFKAIKQSLSANSYLNNGKEINKQVTYQAGYTNVTPDFDKELIERNHRTDEDFDKKTVYSREDAVFYAHTKYDEHPEHIDEFNSSTCLTCIKTYEGKGLEVPCVSDCTAEVHRVDITSEGARAHGMSLENCVQCRTCELICPEQNLRVNAAYAAGGPDFRGL